MITPVAARTVALALLTITTAASAGISYAPGTVVFVDAVGDRIGVCDVGQPFPNATFLHTINGGPSDARNPSQITQDAAGNWYVGDGQFDVSQPGRILKITGLFSGAPSESVFATGTLGDPTSVLDNPTGLHWDFARNKLLVIDNPGNAINPAKVARDNVFLIDTAGAIQTSFTEPADNPPAAYYQDGNAATPDRNTGNYFVVAPNGGVANQGGSQFNNPGVVWRMTFDAAGNATESVFFDFSDYGSALVGQPIGICSAANPDNSQFLFVADNVTNGIYKLIVNPDGSFGGASLIFSNPAIANGLGEIQYDPYNNKLVFNSGGTQQIFRINTDGTSLEVLANGVGARGIYIIPTPGALTLASIATLILLPRRR